jgi:Zn-dependent protease with chaperone function
MTGSRAVSAVPEWKEGLWRPRRAWGKRLLVHAGIPAATGMVLLWWSAAAGVLAAVGLATASFAWVRVQHRLVLRRSGAEPLPGEEARRLVNIAHGTARDLQMAPPRLLVIRGGGPNALVVGGSSPALAVTRSALEAFTRTETLSLVMRSCDGMSMTITRRSTRTICCRIGIRMIKPGPLTW